MTRIVTSRGLSEAPRPTQLAATTAGATDFSALIPPEFAGDRANVKTEAVPFRLGDASDYDDAAGWEHSAGE